VQSFPDASDCEEFDNLSGHLWVQELPTGGGLRFQLVDSGALAFATPAGTGASSTPSSPPYRLGTQCVRERIDREALRAAADDPSAITFFGVVSWYEGIDYDWEALPPFLGIDVWSAAKGRYLPPDAATTAFDRLGLPALPAVLKEGPVAHTDLERFTGTGDRPGSAWADGPAAGFLLRDKTGSRCRAFPGSGVDGGDEPEAATADGLAAEFVTEPGLQRARERLGLRVGGTDQADRELP
jgi:hypothetical protein